MTNSERALVVINVYLCITSYDNEGENYQSIIYEFNNGDNIIFTFDGFDSFFNDSTNWDIYPFDNVDLEHEEFRDKVKVNSVCKNNFKFLR